MAQYLGSNSFKPHAKQKYQENTELTPPTATPLAICRIASLCYPFPKSATSHQTKQSYSKSTSSPSSTLLSLWEEPYCARLLSVNKPLRLVRTVLVTSQLARCARPHIKIHANSSPTTKWFGNKMTLGPPGERVRKRRRRFRREDDVHAPLG